MKLRELKRLLDANSEKQFRLKLPDENEVPKEFHITEVGHVSKRFIDCGGAVHSVQSCLLQAWLGTDKDHQLTAEKVGRVLRFARAVVPNDELDVEVEYEHGSISQYPISDHSVSEHSITFNLALKHTDCLAKDLCIAPAATDATACCKPGCC